MVIKTIITTMDNLPLLKVQIPILKQDPMIDEIVVVNQGSLDGTEEWLKEHPEVVAVNKINDGAGKGRNAGLDAAGSFDYVFMLDGGMRPLLPGIQPMFEFLESHEDADVVGLAWHDLETDVSKAWRRWPFKTITDKMVYPYSCLSLTNYCLCKHTAWDGLRFSEEGPFGEAGWGVDDDEMAYQWREAGIKVFAIEGVKAYRRGSGSFRRLFNETGVWPNQYGSVYEQRVVKLSQDWPHMQWGEPYLTIVIKVPSTAKVDEVAKLVKNTHDGMRKWHFSGQWKTQWQPYSIILWVPDNEEVYQWAEPRKFRQHHGNTIILDGNIVKRSSSDKSMWTGDFRIYCGENAEEAVRETAHWWTVVENQLELDSLLEQWLTTQLQEINSNESPTVIKKYLEVTNDVNIPCSN